MITELFILAMLPALTGLLSLLPSVILDLTSLQAVGSIGSTAGMLNGYFPVATLGMCMGLVLGLKGFMLGYRVILFVYHQIWGSS
jgi:hypothetical protein